MKRLMMAKKKRGEQNAKYRMSAFRESGDGQYLTTNQGLRSTTIRTS